MVISGVPGTYFFFHLLHEKEVQGEQKKYYMKKYKQGEVGGGGKS
jgi:hypothetical protein